jgi:hypothetical protein
MRTADGDRKLILMGHAAIADVRGLRFEALVRLRFGALKCLILLLAGAALASCSSNRVASTVAGMPQWAGGIPKDAPPRPGTFEYDDWQRKRAQDAAAIKSPKRD